MVQIPTFFTEKLPENYPGDFIPAHIFALNAPTMPHPLMFTTNNHKRNYYARQYNQNIRIHCLSPLRCAQALAYIFTRGDRIYHRNYLSASRSTAKNWAYKFRHPIKSRKKKNLGGRPKVTEEIIQIIITFKEQNGHWGSPRIRDELLKMGIKLSKTTISNILKDNGFDPTGDRANKWEKWKGEYKDHIWACDFFFVQTVREACYMCLVVIDTYTKEILALGVHEGRLGIDSYWVAGTLVTAFAKFKRRPENLVHDRGPLFKGQVMRMCSVADWLMI